MEEGSGAPTLEVGFAISAGTSFEELRRLQAFMHTAEFKAISSVEGMEKAFNRLNFTGAKVQVGEFGNVATKEMARVERAGEGVVRQLERQAAEFGKTGPALRDYRSELKAVAAEGQGFTELAARIRAATAEINRLEQGALRPLVPTGKLAGHHMQNLAFQFQDFGIQAFAAAQSSKPFQMMLMAAVQQGSQVAGIMSQAQIGIRGVAAAFLDMSKAVLLATVTNPVLLAIAAAATAATIAVRALNASANSGADMTAYAQSLGLTAKEIRNLDNVTITYGDTVRAVFNVAGRAIWGEVGPAVTSTWDLMKEWLAWVGTGVQAAGNFMIGGFVGAYDLITTTWRQFPSVMGDVFYSGVNASIGAINMLVQKAVAGVNGFIAAANTILDKAGLGIPQLTAPQIAAVDNQFAGAGEKFAGTLRSKMSRAMGVDYIGDFGRRAAGAVSAESERLARSRIKGQAEEKGYLDPEKGKKIKDRLSDEEKAYQAALKAAQSYIDAQDKATARIGKTAKEVRLLDDAAARAAAPTEALKQAIDKAAAAREAAYGAQAARDFDQNVMRPLQDEIALYGLVGPARAQAALELEHEAFVQKQVAAGVDDAEAAWRRYYDAKSQLISKDAAAEREVDRVKRLQEELDALVGRANDAADAMARAFGRVGGAIGDAVVLLADYGKLQKEIDNQLAIKKIGGKDAAAASARLQLDTTIGLIGATKSLFNERSKGYAAMEAAEKALAIVQLARTAIDVAGGAAKMFASLGPLGFPAVAAMLAVMATLGFRGAGGGYTPPETNQGQGTVLGDREAKSDSLKRSIDTLKDVDTVTSVYARQMAASLRSIDSQIGGLASVLVRSGNLNADSQVAQGFKPNAIGSVLGSIPIIGGLLGGLFGSKTKVIGSGIYGGAMSLDAILAGGGYGAQTYSDVEKTKKFLGITTSKKNSTVFGSAVDSSVSDQFGLILRSFNDAILAAAGPLGSATDEIKSRLSGFVFSLGKIDLTGLSGTEIQEKLAAVFGAAADNMASAAFPGITRFQKVGEGAFETLVRVASTVEAVTDTLASFGNAMIGLSIDAKVALAGQFDTVADFTSAASSYFDTFFTKEEQASARATQLTRVFGSLNLVMPRTLTGFRQLVDAQDLNTDAGRRAYATLLQLAPAFSDLMGSLGGAKTAADAAEELREAWTSIGDSIADEVKRIRGLANGGSNASFATLQGQFNAATLGARGGDQAMARMLPELSQNLLAAAERSATSRQELDRIRAVTAASLEATNASILTRTGALTLDELLDRTATAQAASTRQAANDVVAELKATNDNLTAELAQLRQETVSALADIAGSSRSTATTFRNVTSAGGGDRIAMMNAQ